MKLIYQKIAEDLQHKVYVIERRNKQPNQNTFVIGQQLYEKNLQADRSKSKNRYLGPYIFTVINDNNTCMIRSQNQQTKRVHMDNLRHPVPR